MGLVVAPGLSFHFFYHNSDEFFYILDEMEMQIRAAFLKAMSDLLQRSASEMKNEDIEWFLTLCEELKSRINDLTPSRHDLHSELDSSIDIVLLRQMLTNSAFEKRDAEQLVNIIFGRLKSLCAPVQDNKVQLVHVEILNMDNLGQQISTLIMKANMIIDEIEELL